MTDLSEMFTFFEFQNKPKKKQKNEMAVYQFLK